MTLARAQCQLQRLVLPDTLSQEDASYTQFHSLYTTKVPELVNNSNSEFREKCEIRKRQSPKGSSNSVSMAFIGIRTCPVSSWDLTEEHEMGDRSLLLPMKQIDDPSVRALGHLLAADSGCHPLAWDAI